MRLISALMAICRISILLMLVIVGLLAGMISPLMPARMHRRCIRVWHTAVLSILGIRVHVTGEIFKAGSLIVSNHVSWLDISVLGSSLPTIFLAKQEISSWPVLGFVIRKAGTLFIARGKGAKQAIKQISDALERELSVVIFAEGKASEGIDVARFQPRLFQAAIDSGAAVQPIALQYLNAGGDVDTRVSYSGNLTFLQSLWRVSVLSGISVTMTILPAYEASENREKISKRAEEVIRKAVIST